MVRKRLSKSIRKYIRREKARIRREVFNKIEQDKLIEDLYKKIIKPKQNAGKRNLRVSPPNGKKERF